VFAERLFANEASERKPDRALAPRERFNSNLEDAAQGEEFQDFLCGVFR
jgi:hypothetical protein